MGVVVRMVVRMVMVVMVAMGGFGTAPYGSRLDLIVMRSARCGRFCGIEEQLRVEAEDELGI